MMIQQFVDEGVDGRVPALRRKEGETHSAKPTLPSLPDQLQETNFKSNNLTLANVTQREQL